MATTDLQKFAGRPFSFYPPILNIEHNEWTYEEGSWSEVRVRNTKTGEDLWIPRRFLGEVSQVDKPVMIVGLAQELEYSAGMVAPHRRRVIEIPAAGRPESSGQGERRATIPPPSRESPTERRIQRLIVLSLAVAVLGAFLVTLLTRGREGGGRVTFEPVLQADLDLTAEDDYFAVVRKLGEPSRDRWKSGAGERQFRALDYPELGVTVILMGADRESVRYIGAKDRQWRTVHSVKLPGGVNTDSILRALEPF